MTVASPDGGNLLLALHRQNWGGQMPANGDPARRPSHCVAAGAALEEAYQSQIGHNVCVEKEIAHLPVVA